MDHSPLENARVLVSGGTSGIGQAIARRVVKAGGRVVLLGRSRAKLDAARVWNERRKPMVGISTLAAIDAAIEALARVLSLELAPVRVNAVVPGMIDTPIWRARLSEEEQRSFFAATARALPVGRSGKADDVAHAVQFLMENGFTTGAVLDVDGGQR